MAKHKSVNCNVKGCRGEASYWLPTDKLSGDFDVKNDTFYLCEHHTMILSIEGNYEYIAFLNPETGKLREIEVGIYSCNEDCKICNQ